MHPDARVTYHETWCFQLERSSPSQPSTSPRRHHRQNAWLSELMASFMPATSNQEGEAAGPTRAAVASTSADGSAQAKLLKDRLRLVWPSVEAVRTSTKGWQSGGYGGVVPRPRVIP